LIGALVALLAIARWIVLAGIEMLIAFINGRMPA
jgi:hypothetical protein